MRKILCFGLLMALGVQQGLASNSTWGDWLFEGAKTAVNAASHAINKTAAATTNLTGVEAPPFANVTPKILLDIIENYKGNKETDEVRWWEVIGATQAYNYLQENGEKCYRTMMITGLSYYKYNQSIQQDSKDTHKSIVSQEKEFLMAKMNPAEFIQILMNNGYPDHALINNKPAFKPGGSFKRRWVMEKQSDFERLSTDNENFYTFGMTIEVVCYLSKSSPSKNFIDLHLARTLSHTIGQDKNLLKTVDSYTFERLLNLAQQDPDLKIHMDNIKIDNALQLIQRHEESLKAKGKSQSDALKFDKHKEEKEKMPKVLETPPSNAQPLASVTPTDSTASNAESKAAASEINDKNKVDNTVSAPSANKSTAENPAESAPSSTTTNQKNRRNKGNTAT